MFSSLHSEQLYRVEFRNCSPHHSTDPASPLCSTGHLVSQGGAVALQAGHAVRDVLSILLSDSPVGNYVDNYYVVVLVQQHLVRCRLLPVPLRPDLHPVIEADDGAGLDVCNDCLSVPTLCVDVSPVLANSPWPASLILLCLTSTKMAS